MDMINKLIDLIGREATVFADFLELLTRQRQMLVSGDVEGLNACTERQREKLIEASLLNREREQLVIQLRVTMPISGDVTINKLLEHATESQAEQMEKLRDTILELNDEIASVRNSNVLLINQSREFIARTMNMLSKVSAPESYETTAASTDKGRPFFLDRRV